MRNQEKRFPVIFVLLLILFFIVIGLIPKTLAVQGELVETNYQKNVPLPQNLPWYPILVFGDNRPSDTDSVSYPSVFLELLRLIEIINPFAVVGTGDHTGKATLEQVQEFIYLTSNITNLWVIEGNHDTLDPQGLSYWHRYLAPEFYFKDSIPCWRIVFLSSEAVYTEESSLLSFLRETLNTGRGIIVVVHRPLYPEINYNLQQPFRDILLNILESHSNVKLVLQGHWHGFLESVKNNITFLITAGGGAPLYQNGGHYHFLSLILYPNGTFWYKPIVISDGLRVNVSGNRIVINNNLRDLNGSKTTVPVRIMLVFNGTPVFLVALAPPGETRFTYNAADMNQVAFESDRTLKWYVYIPTMPQAIVNSTSEKGGNHLTLNIPSDLATIRDVTIIPIYRTVTRTGYVTIERTVTVEKRFTFTKTIISTTTRTMTIEENLTCTSTTQTGNSLSGKHYRLLIPVLISIAVIIFASSIIRRKA